MVQGHSQSPPGSPVSVSMYFASNRDVPSVDLKDLAQIAVAPAQWLALLAVPQSINLPIIEVQRGIILPHLSPEDLESNLFITSLSPGNSWYVNLTFLLPNPGLPEHGVQGTGTSSV